MVDQRPGPRTVVEPFGVPGGDEGVEGAGADGEEQLDVAVEIVVVSPRDDERELEPVA
jgi:hypothetical protein